MIPTKELPYRVEAGCKVMWHYYRLKSDALIAAAEAEKMAVERLRKGHDFGFQRPGTIEKAKRGYCVCFP